MDEQIIQAIKDLASTLIKHNTMLLSVESCTGGGVGYYCTNESGASNWYAGGHITYSNANKINLGVPAAIVDKYGAVSEQTAAAMSQAAIKHAKQNNTEAQNKYCSLSITGVAGPEGGTKEKPVGTVCFGWTTAAGKTITTTKLLSGSRDEIRKQAILYSLSEMAGSVL